MYYFQFGFHILIGFRERWQKTALLFFRRWHCAFGKK
tara:strand:- start:235 stop:345 length:111 start_codon:yes stop_codon:yes gene_type:complete